MLRKSIFFSTMLATMAVGLFVTRGFSSAITENGKGFIMKEVVRTTVYFLVEDDTGASALLDASNDAAVVTGKPGGLLDITTGTNKCGSITDEFAAYQASSTFNASNDLEETHMFFLSTNDSKPTRIPVSVWFVGTRPNPGKKNVSIALYNEGGYDDSTCTESPGGSAKTYRKYSASMD